MKKIVLLLTCLSLLPIPAAQAGKAGAWIGGAAIGSLGTLAIQGAAKRPKYREYPVEVREVRYAAPAPVVTTTTSSATELRRLQRELNAAVDENRQLSQELREERREKRELRSELDRCLDEVENLQIQLKKKEQEIQKLQREARKKTVEQRRLLPAQTPMEIDEIK